MFQQNLEAIQQHQPQLYSRMEKHLNEHTFESYESEDGRIHGVVKSSEGIIREEMTLHSPASMRKRFYPHFRSYQPQQQWLFLLGIDALMPDLLQEKINSERTPVLIIEPNLAALLLILHENDLRAIFSMPNVHWYIGEKAVRRVMDDMADWLKPYFITAPAFHFIASLQRPDLLQQNQTFVRQVQKRFKELSNEVQQRSNQFLLQYKQPHRAPTRNVVLIVPNVSCWIVLSRGLREGLNDLGYKVVERRIPFPPNRISTLDSLRMWLDLFENVPDCLMTISHPSDLFIQGIETIPLRRFVWYVDDPDHIHSHAHGPYDYLFYSYGEFQERMQDRGKHHLGEIPVGGYALNFSKREAFRCQVGFVGSVMNTDPYREQMPQEIVEKIDRMVEARQENVKTPWKTMLDEFSIHEAERNEIVGAIESLRRRDMTSEQLLYFYLNAEWVRVRRVALLMALHDYDLKIYGNPDWQAVLDGTTLQGAFQGKGLTSRECFDFYHSAEISINIHPPFVHSAPATRDMEIPLCDGFLLSDFHLHALHRTGEFFQPNEEIALYDNGDDLADKVDYYLEHHQERREISERAKKRIFKEHRYAQRMIQLFEHYEEYTRP